MKPFLYLVIVSALVIAVTAALFSVTGIATAFSGHFLQVAIMAGAIEAGKIVVASLLYRYWKSMALIHKAYLTLALIVLMIITSAGIFGYLSEAYQKTKGDYTVIEKQANILKSKKQFFEDRKNRLTQDKEIELKTKTSNQVRADSLTSRGQSITRTREDIKTSENRISSLEQQISAMEDSIGSYDLQIVELESANIKGELGPLTYIASAFNMDMDTVVKYFILVLVFVFDPLAVALIVAANMIYLKRATQKDEHESPEFTEHFVDKIKKLKLFQKKIEPEEPDLSEEDRQQMRKYEKEVGIETLPANKDALEEKPKNVIKRKWKSANWREPQQ